MSLVQANSNNEVVMVPNTSPWQARVAVRGLALLGLCVVLFTLTACHWKQGDKADDKPDLPAIVKLGNYWPKEATKPDQITSLNMNDTQVTDADLKEVAKLTSLTTLLLENTQVTDAGLKELAPLTKLAFIHLDNTQITDAGLRELAPFTKLTELILLKCTHVTEAGIAELPSTIQVTR